MGSDFISGPSGHKRAGRLAGVARSGLETLWDDELGGFRCMTSEAGGRWARPPTGLVAVYAGVGRTAGAACWPASTAGAEP